MTHFKKILVAAIPLVAASFAMAANTIGTSKHNFSTASWSDNQICKPCHTPHNGSLAVTGRIWAHTLSPDATTYTYHGTATTSTDWVTMTESAGSALVTDMDSATRLCLGCHDGTVALDNFMGKTGASDGKFIGDADGNHGSALANLGTNLSNDHPVGYLAVVPTVATSDMKSASTVTTTGYKLKLANKNAAGTYSVSCVTCHSPHGSSNGPAADPTRGMLAKSNAGSALCLSCHIR